MSEPIHVLSLGAGVQSSTLALMAEQGEIGQTPTSANFSDTKDETPDVYVWLAWVREQLSYPSEIVTKGSLSATSLHIREHQSKAGAFWSKSLIPAFIKNPDGSRGIMGRACTADYKIGPLIRATNRLIGATIIKGWKISHAKAYREWLKFKRDAALAKKLGKDRPHFPSAAWDEMQKAALAIQWIGISLDEVQRMKPSTVPWIRHRWPLIEKEMSRADCYSWWDRQTGYLDRPSKYPPRSACFYCPFHSDNEWRRLRDDAPEQFQKAVQFERDLQAVKLKSDNLGGVPFLHDSLKPLDQVDLSTDTERGQGMLAGFGNECEGMCGN